MNDSKSEQGLHITVGTALSSSTSAILESALDTSHEFRLLKAALLYGDRVTFYSIAPTAFLSIMRRPPRMSEDEKLDWFLDFYKKLGHEPNVQKIATFIEEYKTSRRKKRQDYQHYLEYQRAFEKSLRDMEAMAKKGGVAELTAALDSGIVEFEAFSVGNGADQFFSKITDALTSGNTYPLLDEVTGNLVDLAVQAGMLTLLGTSTNRAKQIGLSSGIFSRLPLFDQATISEVIDIRKELSRSLIRFRAAIIQFSRGIEDTPWGKQFQQEVEQIFVEQVEPAILDIEDAVKSNKTLLEIMSRSLTNSGVVTTSVLGIALSQLTQFPDLFVALSVTAGVTLGAYEAVKEHRTEMEKVEKNQLYFYYRAGKLLSK